MHSFYLGNAEATFQNSRARWSPNQTHSATTSPTRPNFPVGRSQQSHTTPHTERNSQTSHRTSSNDIPETQSTSGRESQQQSQESTPSVSRYY